MCVGFVATGLKGAMCGAKMAQMMATTRNSSENLGAPRNSACSLWTRVDSPARVAAGCGRASSPSEPLNVTRRPPCDYATRMRGSSQAYITSTMMLMSTIKDAAKKITVCVVG